ncbi:MAG: response regulator [Proteobacteria bacterium]|nr:MAG: response regulator [Pseudomonadota bacterium]
MAVLLVEDDPMIRLTLADIFEESGLQVFDAGDSKEALKILNEPNQAIDILVTDLDLGPGDNGIALAHQAKRLLPNLRVIYATGSPEILDGHTFGAWEKVFLKPFYPSFLVAAVVAMNEQKRPPHSARPRPVAAEIAFATGL